MMSLLTHYEKLMQKHMQYIQESKDRGSPAIEIHLKTILS